MKTTYLIFMVIFSLGCAKKNYTINSRPMEDIHWKIAEQNTPIVVENATIQTKTNMPVAFQILIKQPAVHTTIKTMLPIEIKKNSEQAQTPLEPQEKIRSANPFEVLIMFSALVILLGLIILAFVAFGFLALFVLVGLLGVALYRSIFPKKSKSKAKQVET
ncbi:MAG: hypothetical protein RL060_1794 [Bacteroidota bacterium]|jgi:hypothetical protein